MIPRASKQTDTTGRSALTRRDFQTLAAAALGGLLTGTIGGCSHKVDLPGPPFGDSHLCRGLNVCKGKDKLGKNECAGTGQCATLTHECATQNKCKNQGGCGETAAANACSGKGGCAVPLMQGAWKQARKKFETEMSGLGVTFGKSPLPKA